MNFDFSPEQEEFRKVVRDFAESEIAPVNIEAAATAGEQR